MYHPWGAFRALTEFTLNFGLLPDGKLGLTNFTDRTVTLAHGLSQAERRSTIAHEVEHILRGYPSCGAEREECLVELRAARKLIGLHELGEAMAWSSDLEVIADELWVDVEMLLTRLENLHMTEKGYLQRRLAAVGHDVGHTGPIGEE